MKPLLLLVDLQQDYLASPGLDPAPEGVVQNAATLVAFCRQHGIQVGHVLTTVSRDPDNRMPHWKRANVWRCERGTPGHEPPAALAPLPGEPIIHKTGFGAPDLAAFLRDLAIDTIVVAGVKTHACVRQVALDAWQAGLAVLIAQDAVASDDPLHAAITQRYLEARGIVFAPAAELAARLNGRNSDIVASSGAPNRTPAAAALDAARGWGNSTMTVRTDLARRLKEVLSAEIEPLARLMASELGKPSRFGRAEGRNAVEMLGGLAGRAEQGPGVADHGPGFIVRRRPHGVVAVITPWNNPIYIALGKIVPAILYGNAVAWKPAPEALAVSRALFQCLAKAGWPEGLVQLVEGGKHEAASLMRDHAVAAVTLTGSSSAGYAAQEICASRRIPLQAELGGNNAAIVWPDANLAEAARMVAAGAFEMAGQRCTANRRIVVHEECRDEFVRLLEKKTAALKWGDPMHDDTVIGPLVSTGQRDRIAAMVERAVTKCGPALLPLGDAPPRVDEHGGKFFPPTILHCTDPSREIVQEETFGPVAVVQPARDWDHAMRLCNGVRQGLAAAVFTSSRDIVARFLDEAEAGILKVNQSTAGAAVDAPFGGWKGSGVGIAEHGRFDIEFFTRSQTVYE